MIQSTATDAGLDSRCEGAGSQRGSNKNEKWLLIVVVPRQLVGHGL